MNTARFRLGFPETDVLHWASRYDVEGDEHIESAVVPPAKVRGYFTKSELQALCKWKSPRSVPRVAKNDEAFVEKVTRESLASTHGQFQIEVLTLLSGVSWPTASVILHWAARDQYPILDFRALWSIGVASPPTYSYPFWAEYTAFCRTLSQGAGATMRELDRALWQYSKEHQKRKR